MGALRTGVFVLFVLLVPVSSQGIIFSDPVICYFLDAFLVVYCIIATALFFKEKFGPPSVAVGAAADNGIYQELDRLKDTDAYQVLEPTKAKKKAGKKKKSESTREAEENKDPTESLITNGSDPPPPLSPH